jgi:hypothetical protein
MVDGAGGAVSGWIDPSLKIRKQRLILNRLRVSREAAGYSAAGDPKPLKLAQDDVGAFIEEMA